MKKISHTESTPENESYKLLDVGRALQSKNPRLYHLTPQFAIRAIERLIHQDEMNALIDNNFNDNSIDFATHIVEYFQIGINLSGEQNIPRTGRYIITSNHPLGGLDGMTLISILGQYRHDIKCPVNDLLMQVKQMHEVFMPINKHGRNSMDSMRKLEEAFASDELILYFPAGLCSRKQQGIIRDLDWKKTVISKARQYQRDIIPVYFDGRNSNRFYNIANLRKHLGIKINLEFVLLPDEMFRQRGQQFNITFGSPIPFSTFNSSKTDIEWVNWLKEQVYSLKNN